MSCPFGLDPQFVDALDLLAILSGEAGDWPARGVLDLNGNFSFRSI